MLARASEYGIGRPERLARSAQSTQTPADATLVLDSPKTLFWVFWAFLTVLPKLKRRAAESLSHVNRAAPPTHRLALPYAVRITAGNTGKAAAASHVWPDRPRGIC
jgi:hypothetical protein